MRNRRESGRPVNLWFVMLVIYIGAIYVNSLTPSGVSAQESGFLLDKIRGLCESLGLKSPWLTEHIIRKTAHFIEYAGLGCLLCANCRTWLPAGQSRVRAAAELAVLVPFVDETIQLFVPGRSGQVSDVWLDLCGAAFGLAMASYFVRLRLGRKANRGIKR